MLDRVPVPTDNIFKFYALFSLVLLIFSIWGTINVQRSSNEVLFKIIPEIEVLKAQNSNEAESKIKLVMLEKQRELVVKDRETFRIWLLVIAGIATVGLCYGFGKWHSRNSRNNCK